MTHEDSEEDSEDEVTLEGVRFYNQDYAWEGEAVLPSWAGFRTSPDGTPSGNTFLIVTSHLDDNIGPPSATHAEALRWLLSHEAAVAEAVVRAVLDYYPELSDDYDVQPGENPEDFPETMTAEALRDFIELHTVFLHDYLENDQPVLGFAFRSRWDEEHGLGVRMHGLEPADVAPDSSVAF